MRAATKEITPGKPTTRRFTKREKDQAVRLMFELRNVCGTTQGTVVRIAYQLGHGTELVRRWAAQAEVDAGDVSDWDCQLALQDAFHRKLVRHAANW